MKREIKFRVWDESKREYLKYDCFFNHRDFSKFICFDREFLAEEEGIIIQQFTSLKDKTGREIYEGDVIKFMGRWDEYGNVLPPDHQLYEVRWFMGGLFAFSLERTCQSFHVHNQRLGVGHTNSEIMGNIFENPELLK